MSKVFYSTESDELFEVKEYAKFVLYPDGLACEVIYDLFDSDYVITLTEEQFKELEQFIYIGVL